jgi:cation:H+ antiporter
MTYLLLLIGFAMILYGADLLVNGATSIAKRFNIPELIIGLTIVAIGTSFPEIMITISSSQQNYHDLIFGNALGSNIVNLGLILGIVAIIHPIIFDDDTKNFHLPLSIMAAAILTMMGNGIIGQHRLISRHEGWILIGFSVAYFIYPIFTMVKDVEHEADDQVHISLPRAIFALVVGIVLLKFGSDWAVDNAAEIGRELGMSESVIGLTIIGMGTALPELVTSIIAARKGDPSLAVGNLIGSTILNFFLIIGIGAAISPLKYTLQFNFELVFLFFLAIMIWLFLYIGNKKNRLGRLKGMLLIGVFLAYLIYMLMTS